MWSDLAAWFASPAGQRALTDAVLPVAAVLVAAALAALIARGAVRRLERRLDRDSLVTAIGGFAEAARRAAAGDRASAAHLGTESDVRLRFSARPGADLAAEWAFRVALSARGDDVAVLRDRLLAWAARPARARKLFAADLEALQPEGTSPAALLGWESQPDGGEAGRANEQPPAVAATEHANQPARPGEPEVPAVRPSTTGRTSAARPAWLDDYDDDAHVTRNIPLNTPAPVAASEVRDRGRGDDIVPN